MTHPLRIERERRLLTQHEVPERPHPEATRHLSDTAALRDRQYDIVQHIQETLDNPQTRDTFFRRLFGLFDGNNGQTFLERLRAFFHGNTQPSQPTQSPTQQPLTQLPVQQIPHTPLVEVQSVPEMLVKQFEDQVRAIPLPQGVTITTCRPEVVIISYKNNTENVWLTQPGNADSIRTSLPEMARRLVSRVDGTPLPPQEEPRETPQPPFTPEAPGPEPETADEFRAKLEAATLLPYVTIARIEDRTVVLACLGEEQPFTIAPGADVTQEVTDAVRVMRYNNDRRIDALRDAVTLPDGMTIAAAETSPYWQLLYRGQAEGVDVFAVPLTGLVAHAQTQAETFKRRVDAPRSDDSPPETRESDTQTQIDALRTEIATLAENAGIPADGIDAHIDVIREKIVAVNALIATARSVGGGRFRPRWEGRFIAARPALNVNYIGDDQTGQVEMKEITYQTMPADFAEARRTRNLGAETIMKTNRHIDMGVMIARLLNEMGPQTSGNYTFEPVPADNTTGYKFRIVVNSGGTTETWYVSRPKTSEIFDSEDLIIWKAAPDGSCDRRTQAYIEKGIFTVKRNPAGRLAAIMDANWTETFDQYRRIANFNRASEERDAARMLPRDGQPGFDFPKNRPIGALQLFGFQYDGPKFQSGRENFARMVQTLTSQGYRMAPLASGLSQDMEKTNPLMIIEDAIQQNLALGITDLYLNIAAHGSESGGFIFPKGPARSDGRWNVRYEDMMSIFRRYPQMHVTIDTCACFGAWGATPDQDPDQPARMPYVALLDNPGATEGRITVITHTISTSSNLTGDEYPQLLEYYLAQGKPYGEAHMLADAATQIHIGLNPGVRRSSGLDNGYVETAREQNRNVPVAGEEEQYI